IPRGDRSQRLSRVLPDRGGDMHAGEIAVAQLLQQLAIPVAVLERVEVAQFGNAIHRKRIVQNIGSPVKLAPPALPRALLEKTSLRHVTLLQGTKAYGSHLHPICIPARERTPRDPHDNFYWLQEDFLTEQAAEHDFAWTILRPQSVFGGACGVAMNIVPV